MLMMLAAWLMFSVVDTTVKWLVVTGLPALQVAFMRYFSQLVISLFGCIKRGHLVEKTPPKTSALLLVRGLLLVSATASNFIALKYLSLTMTASIMFSAPIIVSALSGPMLNEKVGPWRWFAICLGFMGVLVIVHPWEADFHWAAILVLYNATALALFSILTRKLSGKASPHTMQIYVGLTGVLLLFPFAAVVWKNPDNLRDWILMCSFGVFAWAGHDVFSRAHAHADASVLMPFQYSFILFMSFGSFLVFGDVPQRDTLIGAAIIVLAGLIIWWREKLRGSTTPLTPK